MRIKWKKLKNLDVETKSGVAFGHVKDLIFEVEGQMILQYEVGSLVGKKYLISREQVLSIDDEKMIVDDAVINVGEEEKERKNLAEPEGAVMDQTSN